MTEQTQSLPNAINQQIEMRSFVEQNIEQLDLRLVKRSDAAAKAIFSKPAESATSSLDQYRIVPKPLSFWGWIVYIFKCIFCLNKPINENIKNQVIDHEMFKSLEKYTPQISDHFLDQIQDGQAHDLMEALIADLRSGKVEVRANDTVEEKSLNFAEDDHGFLVPADTFTKKAIETRVDEICEYFNNNLDEIYTDILSDGLVDTLRREFECTDKLEEILRVMDQFVEMKLITKEELDDLLITLHSSNDKDTLSLRLNAWMAGAPIKSQIVDQIGGKKLLSALERDVLKVLLDPTVESNRIESESVKNVLAWGAGFIARHEDAVKAYISFKIEVEIHKYIEQEMGFVTFSVPVKGIEVVETEFNTQFKQRIETRLDEQLRKAKDDASEKYPRLAEIKAFEIVFGPGNNYGIDPAKLEIIVQEALFILEEVQTYLTDEGKAIPAEEDLSKESIMNIVLKLYYEKYKDVAISLREEAQKYLDIVQGRAERKIERAVRYAVGEHMRLQALHPTISGEQAVSELSSVAMKASVNALSEWINTFPDLVDRKEVLSEVSTDMLMDLMSEWDSVEDPMDLMYSLADVHTENLIQEQVDLLFNTQSGKFIMDRLATEMEALVEKYPSVTQRRLVAISRLVNKQLNFKREFTNMIVGQVKDFIKDELSLTNVEAEDRLIENTVEDLMIQKLDDMLLEAQREYELIAANEKEQILAFRDAEVNKWLEAELKKMAKQVKSPFPEEAVYENVALLVRDSEADELQLTDAVYASLDYAVERMTNAYRKEHPDLVNGTWKVLSPDQVRQMTIELISERLESARGPLAILSEQQMKDYVHKLDSIKELNHKLGVSIASSLRSTEEAFRALASEPESDLQVKLNEISTQFKENLKENIDSQNMTKLAKERSKAFFGDELIECIVTRGVRASILASEERVLNNITNDLANAQKGRERNEILTQPLLNAGHGKDMKAQQDAIEALTKQLIMRQQKVAQARIDKFKTDLLYLKVLYDNNLDSQPFGDFIGTFRQDAISAFGDEETVQDWIQTVSTPDIQSDNE